MLSAVKGKGALARSRVHHLPPNTSYNDTPIGAAFARLADFYLPYSSPASFCVPASQGIRPYIVLHLL